MAAAGRNFRGTQILVEAGALLDIQDKNGRTTLHYATTRGDGYRWSYARNIIIKVLLQAGASKNTADKDGKTPLMCAVEEGDAEIVQVLLEAGALVDIEDKLGKTALHYSACWGKEAVVKVLLEACSSGNLSNERRSTESVLTTEERSTGSVQTIPGHAAGVFVNTQDNDGRTALHQAAESFGGYHRRLFMSEAVITVLLEAGASKNLTDRKGKTLLMLLVEHGRYPDIDPIMDLLESGDE